MAPADRPPSQHLDFLAAAAKTVRQWGLFPIVRGAEARAGRLPRVGRARLPSQNIVDLAQAPSLAFEAHTLDRLDIKGGRATVAGHWLGLTGPMGPLPIHLTEFAAYEARYAKSRPFGRWLDVLAGRMLQFFYRAWGDSQPVVSLDRPDDDQFSAQLGALTGATRGVSDRSAFPPLARLHYAALFGGRRSAVAIEDALSHLMRQRVALLEYQPRWRDIEPGDRTRLGNAYATLDGDAVLGSRVRTVSDAFRVVIRAASERDYRSLLPGGARYAIAAEALDAFAPSHLEWDLAVEVGAGEAFPARLDGRSQLGWIGWLGKPQDVRRDAHLRRRATTMKI